VRALSCPVTKGQPQPVRRLRLKFGGERCPEGGTYGSILFPPAVSSFQRTGSTAVHHPRPLPLSDKGLRCRIFSPALPDYPAASVRDLCSGAFHEAV
jgi:hypothetical protein